MAREHDERGGDTTTGERNAGQGRDGERSAQTWNDLDRHAGLDERLDLLATAAEDEGIAALEADDPPPAAGPEDHQAMDRVLADAGPAGTLADEEPARARREGQSLGRDERVVQHEVRFGEAAGGTQRQQLRVARSRADEGDEAGHRGACRRS